MVIPEMKKSGRSTQERIGGGGDPVIRRPTSTQCEVLLVMMAPQASGCITDTSVCNCGLERSLSTMSLTQSRRSSAIRLSISILNLYPRMFHMTMGSTRRILPGIPHTGRCLTCAVKLQNSGSGDASISHNTLRSTFPSNSRMSLLTEHPRISLTIH